MATTKNIQSVERAFHILELFQKGKSELSVKEIANELDLNKSTTFGLINTLANIGYLQQNEDNQKYGLGFKVLSLTNTMKLNHIIIQTVHPFLKELSQRYQETVHCAVESNGSVVYLDKVEADSSIYINTQMGTKNYLHCTGVGKCILAYLPPEQQNVIFNRGLKTMTYNTITNVEQLRRELALCRQNGYAMDNEEIEIGLSCISVPVFKDQDKVAFGISLSGPTPRILKKKTPELIADMKQTASQISRLLYPIKP